MRFLCCFCRCRVDAANHKKNIFHDVLFEAPIELVGDHTFHELQLLHPYWACDLYEESAVTNFFGLGVARDGFADDLVPNRPDAVFVKPWRQVEPLQGLIENLPDTL